MNAKDSAVICMYICLAILNRSAEVIVKKCSSNENAIHCCIF